MRGEPLPLGLRQIRVCQEDKAHHMGSDRELASMPRLDEVVVVEVNVRLESRI